MNARQQVIDHILSTFYVPQRNLKAVFDLPEVIPRTKKELPSLEDFMSPPPDVLEADDPVHPWDKNSHPVSVLGDYQCMHSAGKIRLYTENLTLFFWRLALDIEQSLPGMRWNASELKVLTEWVVNKTYWHERFHHSLDVIRRLLAIHHIDIWHEEALAVAYSRYYLIEKTFNVRARQRNTELAVIWDVFIHFAFQYQSQGYRDWVHYSDLSALKTGICDYLAPKSSLMLKSARVPVADMLFKWLPVEGGFYEKMT